MATTKSPFAESAEETIVAARRAGEGFIRLGKIQCDAADALSELSNKFASSRAATTITTEEN